MNNGFALVELAVVVAVAAVLAALAMPAFRGSQLRAGRIDAIDALNRVRSAQERYRAATGLYAAEFAPLSGAAARSARGLYQLALTPTGPDSYRAEARAQGVQADDAGCAVISLEVSLGFASAGPSAACWNR